MSNEGHWKRPVDFSTCEFHKTLLIDGKPVDIYTGFGTYGTLFILLHGDNYGEWYSIYGQFLLRHEEDDEIFEQFKRAGLEKEFEYLVDFAKEYYNKILS